MTVFLGHSFTRCPAIYRRWTVAANAPDSRETFQRLDVLEHDNRILELFRDGKSLWALSEIYRDQHFAIRGTEQSRRDRKYWTEEELARAGKLLADSLANLTPDDILKINSPWTVLFAWRDASSTEVVSDFFRQAFERDADLIRLLAALKIVSSRFTERRASRSR